MFDINKLNQTLGQLGTNPMYQMGLGILGQQGSNFNTSVGRGLQAGQATLANQRAAQSNEMMKQLQLAQAASNLAGQRDALRRSASGRKMATDIFADGGVTAEGINQLAAQYPGIAKGYKESYVKPEDVSNTMKKHQEFQALKNSPEFRAMSPEQQKMTEKAFYSGGGVNVNVGAGGGYKLPSDHMYADPNDPTKGVKPIPGSKTDLLNRDEEAKTLNLDLGLVELDRIAKMKPEDGPMEYLGRVIPYGERNKVLNTTYINTMMQLKNLYELGAIQQADAVYMEKALADPTAWYNISIESLPAQIKQLRQILRRSTARGVDKLPGMEGNTPVPAAAPESKIINWSDL